MFLKEVTLQGFKSYAERNVVGPFDSHFNALTGLNGSGKSNVLDGICFALGLTTLSHVRLLLIGAILCEGLACWA